MTVKSQEVIYLIDTGDGIVWCDDPDPTGYGECGDAVKYVQWNAYEALQAECEKLRSILIDLKDWDCDVRGGFLSIPVDLRRRMQEALDSARHEPGHDSDGMVE